MQGLRESEQPVPATVAGPGLLAEYGIDVAGSSEDVASLGRMLAERPMGEVLVLIAEQGRKYGVRLYASVRFDQRTFEMDAARFGMTFQQARIVSLNLVRYPE